ncbi:MAG: GTPase Era [Clostridiales bacterium]|jgi:GTP-binding protein Era|nr:GTPase Era [Clostridiales bacterium]
MPTNTNDNNPKTFKSGFISIIGKPNVGKSTFLNRVIGEKIAAVSYRPQTTRNKILGITTTNSYQMIFIDTPGLHTPKNKLGEFMQYQATGGISDGDIILSFVDSAHPYDPETTKGILVINKIDTINKPDILPLIQQYSADFPHIFPISARTGEGVDELISYLISILPIGPKFFDEDTLTDQPEKVIASEMIREKCFKLLDKELPFGIAVEIEKFKTDEKNIIHIDANIFCEKNSHKAIIIGKKGATLKEIGAQARRDIERFLGEKVFLQTWVKVRENWRNSASQLKNFGYINKE